jgi:uncharacterized protein YlxW (UPF0749 family)
MMILGLFGRIEGNPDPETLKFALGIAFGIISALLAVVFYFYKQKQRDAKKDKEEERAEIALKINSLAKQQKESTDKLSTVVETVSETVNNLKTIVEVIKEQQEERDPRTERRLNVHSDEIQKLKVRVAKIETHCHLNHSTHVET